MALLLSLISGPSVPAHPSERRAVLKVGRSSTGYRISAKWEGTGRPIGRWIGDCFRTTVESALLWLSMHNIAYTLARDSVDPNDVLDRSPPTRSLYASRQIKLAAEMLLENLPQPDAAPKSRRVISGPAGPEPEPAPVPAPPDRKSVV